MVDQQLGLLWHAETLGLGEWMDEWAALSCDVGREYPEEGVQRTVADTAYGCRSTVAAVAPRAVCVTVGRAWAVEYTLALVRVRESGRCGAT